MHSAAKGNRDDEVFCYIASSGDIEHTNLQLYSLKRGADEWNELVDAVERVGLDAVDHLTERLAFVLSCLGLSLSQLIGQNCPSPDKEKMDQPGDLLSALLNRITSDRTTRRRLNSTFGDFLRYYGAIRHFGRIKDNKNYRAVDELTLDVLNRFRLMAIEIWNLVIDMYHQDKENNIEFTSVTEVVFFQELAKPGAGTLQ